MNINKTKELKTPEDFWYDRNPSHDFNSSSGEDMFMGTAMQCMRDYAKYKAIEFTEWRDSMHCPYTQIGNGMWAHTELEEEPNLTTGQLYDLFIEHQKTKII